MPYLHDAQLANIVTSYCTCLGGLLPLLFCAIAGKQPARWRWGLWRDALHRAADHLAPQY